MCVCVCVCASLAVVWPVFVNVRVRYGSCLCVHLSWMSPTVHLRQRAQSRETATLDASPECSHFLFLYTHLEQWHVWWHYCVHHRQTWFQPREPCSWYYPNILSSSPALLSLLLCLSFLLPWIACLGCPNILLKWKHHSYQGQIFLLSLCARHISGGMPQ